MATHAAWGSRLGTARLPRAIAPPMSGPVPSPTPQAISDCIGVLEALVEHPALLASVDLETRNRLVIAAGRVSRPDRAEQTVLSRAVRRKLKNARRSADEAQLLRTGIRQ